MKNFMTVIICFLLLITMCVSLASCSQNDTSDSKNEETSNSTKEETTNSTNDKASIPMKFEKKYVSFGDDSSYSYIFYADGTGIYEVHYSYVYEENSDHNFTLSGKVEFVWREASDGAVYLFETDVKYNDDHTEGKTISVPQRPIYFSEDFLVYTNGDNVASKYIIEGSELDKLLED